MSRFRMLVRWGSAAWPARRLFTSSLVVGLAASVAGVAAPRVSVADNTPAATFVAQYDSGAAAYPDIGQRAAEEGIGILAPVRAMPVIPAAQLAPRELPLDPMPCSLRPAEGLQDASVQAAIYDNGRGEATATLSVDDAGDRDAAWLPDDLEDRGTVLFADNTGDEAAALPIECAHVFPDIPDVPAQPYDFGLATQNPFEYAPMTVVTSDAVSRYPWFASVASIPGFSYHDGGWTYRDAAGPAVSMGNLITNAPLWGSAVPMGGLQVSSGWGGDPLSVGAVAYTTTVGRLNYTDMAAASGGIDYGVTAGSGALRYGLTPEVTLETQMQSAPNMSTQGMGTTYNTGQFGTFHVGVTQSHFDEIHAWRYRFGYQVSLMESFSLAVTNEQVDPGFGDLSTYRSGSFSAPVMRNTLAAGVPLHGWGTLQGTYTGARERGEAVEQRVGLTHSQMIAPHVQLAIGANRDLISGQYGMSVGLTMPVDAFMQGRWLPW